MAAMSLVVSLFLGLPSPAGPGSLISPGQAFPAPPDVSVMSARRRTRRYSDWRAMPARSRHAKPKSRASTFGPLAAAAATLAGVAAAFVFLQGGPADAGPSHPASVLSSANRQSGLAGNLMAAAIHRAASAAQTRMAVQRARAAARRRHLARAARRHARQPPAPTQVPSPPPQPGGDAAHSALGICIRSAEEGGSYAWGPVNGGRAYQFLLSNWGKS